ncbi:MAG: hypothetical protein RIC03_13110 [Cyclobacteriaceae bacterium]
MLLLIVAQLDLHAQYKVDKFSLDGNLYSWYDQEIGKNNSGILVGQYQEIQRLTRKTHQFFGSKEWANVTLKFRGQQYDSIFALYDISKDVFVIKHPVDFRLHNQPILLPQDQIEWFLMNNHAFRYYPEGIKLIPPGFFDELFISNEIALVAKRKKNVETNQTLEYEPSDQYFLNFDGEYHKVWGRWSVLNVLKPYKSKLKSYITANQLRIKAKAENDGDLIELLDYAQQLITPTE